MSKTPKRPNERNDSNRQEESGVPRSSASARKPRSSPKRKAETVSDSVNTEVVSGDMESPEGKMSVNDPSVQDGTRFESRNMITGGDQKGQGEQGSDKVTRDEAGQQEQTAPLSEGADRRETDQTSESNLPQSAFRMEEKAERIEVVPSGRHPITPEVGLERLEGAGNPAHPVQDGEPVQVTEVEAPRHEAASKPVGGASGHVKVWSQGIATHLTRRTDESGEPANPIFILAAIGLGIPALALIALVGVNPGVQEGTFITLLTFLVISAFVIAAVFEIKRIADQGSDADRH